MLDGLFHSPYSESAKSKLGITSLLVLYTEQQACDHWLCSVFVVTETFVTFPALFGRQLTI